MERDLLLRLWYIQISGRDYSTARQTMHSLKGVVSMVGQALGPRALHILGAPMRNHQELTHAIEMNREVVAELGRELAQHYSFEYPSELEATVLQSWLDFAWIAQ